MALCPRNILSLCAGVGGLELGISLALRLRGEQARGICYVEREAAAAASLVASMEAGWLHPAPVWSDLLTFDARSWRGLIHILASGDPCQDNSVAGNRAGAEGERFLAPEVVRVAEECRPDHIFRENVPGNADGQLQALIPALEGLGYRVAGGIFSSSETGNTMRRERMFILAERQGGGFRERGQADQPGSVGHPDGGRAGLDGAARREGQLYPGQWQSRSGEADTGGPSDPMGSSECGGDRRIADDAGRQSIGRTLANRPSDSDQPGAAMARAGGAGLQGHELDGACDREQHGIDAPRPAPELRRVLLPPAVIPGPSDTAGWLNVLDRFPEYQPALSQEEAESHLRRGIDAMANRIERLRATGNGVDPVAAAYAFLSLNALLAAA